MEFPFKFIQLFNLALSFVIILIIGRLCLHNYGQLRYQVFTTGCSNILSQWSIYCLELCLFVPKLSWKRNRFLETLNNWQKHKWSETSYSRATGFLFFFFCIFCVFFCILRLVCFILYFMNFSFFSSVFHQFLPQMFFFEHFRILFTLYDTFVAIWGQQMLYYSVFWPKPVLYFL